MNNPPKPNLTVLVILAVLVVLFSGGVYQIGGAGPTSAFMLLVLIVLVLFLLVK